MRLARPLLIALLPVALAGCLHVADRPRWLDPFPLLGATPDGEAAAIEYVLIQRPAGGDDVNRRVWDRVDEQVLPFETRTLLEDAGLRVGIASESAPGPLRKMIDDPRTDRGHRGRLFALDQPTPLAAGALLPRAEFRVPAPEHGDTKFARDTVCLGFEITVHDAGEGRVLIRLVPNARYRDPNRLLPTDGGIRGEATEDFPGAAFELIVAPTEYLVIGTDWYWKGTFGHLLFTGGTDDRPVQRLLVLRGTQTNASGPVRGEGDDGIAPPLASQVIAARGSRP
jgi:hypothetical protein